jgi:mono/diheme cytochrome c family protein
MTRRPNLLIILFTMNWFATLAAAGSAALLLGISLSAQHHDDAHRHPSAARLKNPNRATAESIAAGRVSYDKHCAECHGATGKGNGKKGEGLEQKPSNLTDEKWEHGSTDGEIFVVIRDGAGAKSEMKGFGTKISQKEMWDIVNFVRSLHDVNH